MTMNKIGRSLLSLFLAAVLLAGVSALADDGETGVSIESGACSITVHLFEGTANIDASEEMSEAASEAAETELAGAELIAYVYQVATAEKSATDGGDDYQSVSYDAYTFTLTDAFRELDGQLKREMGTDDIDALAAGAKEYAADAEPVQTVKRDGDAEDITIEGLDCGLYLILLGTEGQKPGIVQTDSFTYTYKPVLVSLPTRDSDTVGNTSFAWTNGTGTWIYDVEVNLVNKKGAPVARTNSVYIQKTYTAESAAQGVKTCMFEVSATQYGEVIYDNIITLTLAAGELTQTYKVPFDFPVGAVVTAQEVYAGAGFEQASADTYWTVGTTVQNSESITFSFTNEPVSGAYPPRGGSVTNQYTAVTSVSSDGSVYWEEPVQIPNGTSTAQ